MQKVKRSANDAVNRAVDELLNYRKLANLINKMERRCEELRERYIGTGTINYDMVRVEGGRQENILVQIAVEWADLDVEIHAKRRDLERIWIKIQNKLYNLTSIEGRVLELYYIKGYSRQKIAIIMDYSEAGIREIKRRALQKYAEI